MKFEKVQINVKFTMLSKLYLFIPNKLPYSRGQ